MNWHIAEAEQSFSRLVEATHDEPQLIYDRDRLVAAVVEAETFQEFVEWRKRQRPSLAAGAAEVRRVCAEEGYVFEIPERKNRPNPFADALDDLSR